MELMSTTPFPFLTTLVLIPAAGAAVVALIPRGRVAAWVHEAVGLAVSLVTLALAITVLLRFQTSFGGYQFTSDHIWAKTLGIHWSLGLDGISLFLVMMAAVLFPLTMLGARVKRDPRSFVAWVLLLEAACLGSFVSLDL
ncbi:MAG: Fe-S-binding domain-containing protein, partial [Acidimicrobiales bacterium]